jgi:hypothetical protein
LPCCEAVLGNRFVSDRWNIVEALIGHPILTTFYCVVDGFDEWGSGEGKNSFLERLATFYSSESLTSVAEKLRMIITSRNMRQLKDFPRIDLHVDYNKNVTRGIPQVIRFEVQRLPLTDKLDECDLLSIEEYIEKHSEGNFRVACPWWMGCPR